MNRLPVRTAYAQGALVVVLVLVAASLVIDSPIARAAPNLAGGLIVIAVAGLLGHVEPLTRVRTLAVVLAFAVGGLGLWYVGLAALGVVERLLSVQVVTDVALLVGLGLFVWDLGPPAQ